MLGKGLEDELGTHVAEVPSVAFWRSKPNGRDHIDAMVEESGMDITSPMWEFCKFHCYFAS